MTAPSGSVATAAEQLRRLLLALPALADDRVHEVAEIADRVGTTEETIRRDLTTLVNRVSDEPAGFTEGVSLLLSANTVQFVTSSGHFRRPMALSLSELQALELGLAMLAQEVPPDERATIEKARVRVRQATAAIPADDPMTQADRIATLGRDAEKGVEMRRTLQDCIRGRRVATIRYPSSSGPDRGERRVRPLGFVWARGSWFVVAWCELNDGLRVFRFDRMLAVQREETKFTPPAGFSLESVLRDGKVLTGTESTQMRVRYSPRIARWIAERERVREDGDGSVVMDVPLLDEDWALRRVLRYGPDAVVEQPEQVRTLVMERLRGLASAPRD